MGISGVIVEGLARDIDESEELRFPVFGPLEVSGIGEMSAATPPAPSPRLGCTEGNPT